MADRKNEKVLKRLKKFWVPSNFKLQALEVFPELMNQLIENKLIIFVVIYR